MDAIRGGGCSTVSTKAELVVKKIIDKLVTLGGTLSGVFLAAIVGMIFLDVMLRYLFNSPLIFADEISTYLFVGFAFGGLGYTFRAGGHIRVELLLNRVGPSARRHLDIFFHFLFLFYCVILLIALFLFALAYYNQGVRSFTSLRVPLVLPGALMPVGMLLLVLQIIAGIRQLFSGRP